MLNEGLEVLGTDEYLADYEMWNGVFQRSTLESVTLPSTLKRIEYRAFAQCRNLRKVQLPEGLEFIGKGCFANCGLEEVVLPSSVRTVGTAAFQNCERL